MVDWFKPIFCGTEIQKISDLNKEISKFGNDLALEKLENEQLIQDNYKTKMDLQYSEQKIKDLEKINAELNALVPEPIEGWELAWEKKFKKTKVKWSGRPVFKVINGKWEITEVIAVDVMAFWMPASVGDTISMLKSLHAEKIKNKDWDSVAWECENHVKKTIKYVSELPKEYWKFAFETERDKAGDCEDGAIDLANIMYGVGIPPGRIKVNVGDVNGGKHAYVSYCRKTDDSHVILDWCFWTTTKKIADRKLHSQSYDYYGVDFCFTPKATWAKPDYKEIGS